MLDHINLAGCTSLNSKDVYYLTTYCLIIHFLARSGELIVCSFALLSQVMAHARVASASVTRIGRVRIVTAPHARTPACPVWDCCVVGVVSVCAAAANAHSPEPMGPPAISVPPALTPAL